MTRAQAEQQSPAHAALWDFVNSRKRSTDARVVDATLRQLEYAIDRQAYEMRDLERRANAKEPGAALVDAEARASEFQEKLDEALGALKTATEERDALKQELDEAEEAKAAAVEEETAPLRGRIEALEELLYQRGITERVLDHALESADPQQALRAWGVS